MILEKLQISRINLEIQNLIQFNIVKNNRKWKIDFRFKTAENLM